MADKNPLHRLAVTLRKAADNFEANAAQAVQQVAHYTSEELVLSTRFDTGAAKLSFIINPGTPSYVNFYDRLSHGSRTAIETEVIAGNLEDAQRQRLGEPIYLTNAAHSEKGFHYVTMNLNQKVDPGYLEAGLHRALARFLSEERRWFTEVVPLG